MAATTPSRVAGGDIYPSRFVKANTTYPNTVDQAGAGERVFGISQPGTRDAPIPGASTLAAASGQALAIYGDGEEGLLELGTGGATAGAQLKADADGKGIITVTANDLVGAVANESGAAGEKIKVTVQTNRKV